MSVSFCLPYPVAVSAFMICRGLCACTEMLWMCELYVSFWSKVSLPWVISLYVATVNGRTSSELHCGLIAIEKYYSIPYTIL